VSEKEKNESKDLENLINAGSEISGGAVGGVLGFLMAGPVGAAVGGAAGPVLTRTINFVAQEIKNRVLGKREEARIGATIVFASQKIQENLKEGQQVRNDDFFTKDSTHRSAAEEILEGVLLASQQEHEEKKLKYVGNLLANIAFHPEIDRAQANLLVRLAERLSYRQLCLLFLFAPKGNPMNLKSGDYRTGGIKGTQKISLLQEIYDMYQQAMLNCGDSALIDISDIDPSRMKTHGMGGWLYQLMELKTISMDDIKASANLLKD